MPASEILKSLGYNPDTLLTEQQPPDKTNTQSFFKDLLAVPLLKGAVGVGQTVVGVADLATGGLAGNALSELGYNSGRTNQFINDLHSDEYLKGQREVQQAGEIDGSQLDKGLNTLGALIANPSQAVGSAVESLPLMLPGIGLQSKIYKTATLGLEGAAKAKETMKVSPLNPV